MKIVAKTLGDRVAEKHQCPFVGGLLSDPGTAALLPQVFEPVRAADRPGAGEALVGVGDHKRRRLVGAAGQGPGEGRHEGAGANEEAGHGKAK